MFNLTCKKGDQICVSITCLTDSFVYNWNKFKSCPQSVGQKLIFKTTCNFLYFIYLIGILENY